jgi:hypothetical protein
MGAKHILDLTSEATHLICGALGSPKYRYVAKMRPDIKVMSTKWVEAMYTQWIAGEDIDARSFEREYRFPILYGIRLSVTGIVDGMDTFFFRLWMGPARINANDAQLPSEKTSRRSVSRNPRRTIRISRKTSHIYSPLRPLERSTSLREVTVSLWYRPSG